MKKGLQCRQNAVCLWGMNLKPIAIGSRIEATVTSFDSFYKRVRGTVTGIRNGRYQIEADEVISKWDNDWAKHPSSCSMSVSPKDVVDVPEICFGIMQ